MKMSATRQISPERRRDTRTSFRCLAVSYVAISPIFSNTAYIRFVAGSCGRRCLARSRTYSRVLARIRTCRQQHARGICKIPTAPTSRQIVAQLIEPDPRLAFEKLSIFFRTRFLQRCSSRDTHSRRVDAYTRTLVIHATRRPTVMTLANCWAPTPFPNDLSTIATPCQSNTIVSTVIVAINRNTRLPTCSLFRLRRCNYRRSNYETRVGGRTV